MFFENPNLHTFAHHSIVIKFLGLAELLFFCYKWGRKHLLFYGPFNVEHLCLTVILFGLNKLQTENFEATVAWLEQVKGIFDMKLTIHHRPMKCLYLVKLHWILMSREVELVANFFSSLNFFQLDNLKRWKRSIFWKQVWIATASLSNVNGFRCTK